MQLLKNEQQGQRRDKDGIGAAVISFNPALVLGTARAGWLLLAVGFAAPALPESSWLEINQGCEEVLFLQKGRLSKHASFIY